MADRAVSTVVSYVLILGIVALLLSVLTAGFAPLVTNQQDDAVRSTLEVLGNDVAGDLESADRLAVRAGEGGAVELHTDLPTRVGGSQYEIEIDEPAGESYYEIVLRSPDHDTRVTVRVRTETAIDVGAIDVLDGGPLEISGDEDGLVIENA